MPNPAAQKALEAHQLRYAKKGVGWGIFSGATWGLQGTLLYYVALVLAPFWMEDYGLWLVVLGSLAGACMHDGFAGLLLAIINAFTGRWKEYVRTLRTRPGKLVCLAALCGGPVGMAGYLVGISLATPTYALAISATYPALGAILGVFILKERIVPRVWVGIIACTIGAFIVGYMPPEGGIEQYPYFYLGIALCFLPVFGWALEGVIATYGMDMVDPDITVGIRGTFSFLVMLIIVLPVISMIGGEGLAAGWKIFGGALAAGTPAMWVAVAGLSGGLSQLAWYRALNMTGVGRAMAFNVTYALWSIPFGWLLAMAQGTGFTVTTTAIIGAVIITTGTILVVANPKELLKLRN